jgi:hypothetical protein
MLGQIARAAVRVLVSMASGALLAALYAALVGTVHLGAYGRWAGIPAFAVGCILVGVVLGLLGCVVWALSGAAAQGSEGSGPPPGSSRPPGVARRPADAEGRGCGRQPARPCDGAARDGLVARPGCWSWVRRRFASPN